MAKQLEKDSCLTHLDLDNDGIITDKEIELQAKLDENERKNEKAEFNASIAKFCLGSVTVLIVVLLSGFVPEPIITASMDAISVYLFGMISLAGAVVGLTGWMSKG